MSTDIEKLIARVENKNQHITCCGPCHFSWEEEHALGYLPEKFKYRDKSGKVKTINLQKWLVSEHKRILEGGMKPEEILKHSQQEIVFFRRYLPRDILERIEADHLLFCQENDFKFELDGKLYEV